MYEYNVPSLFIYFNEQGFKFFQNGVFWKFNACNIVGHQ